MVRHARRRVLLLDVMSTLVRDPFYEDVPRALDTTLEALIEAKDPATWPAFECDHIDEAQLGARFFRDGRGVDVQQLKRAMRAGYAWLPGIEDLLGELAAAGVEMHALSNYPSWFRLIEDTLGLSRWVSWTFVSCKTGLRKPDPRAYVHAVRALAVAPGAATFVDDRADNCDAAVAAGLVAVPFVDAAQLRRALAEDGWPIRT